MGERVWPSLCSCRCSRVTLPADGRLTRQRDIGRSSRSRSLASTFEFLPPPTRAKDVPRAGRSDTGSRRSYTRVESGDMSRVCRVATTESPELARRGLGCSSFGSCASLPAPCRTCSTPWWPSWRSTSGAATWMAVETTTMSGFSVVRWADHAPGERAALSGHQAAVNGTRPGGLYRASPNTATPDHAGPMF